MEAPVTTGSMPPGVQADPAANVHAGVTVYFLGGGQNLLYVKVDGQWVEYVRSVPPSGAHVRAHTLPGADTQTGPVHWAGYTCHSPDEITRERKRRIYHDPASSPDLFPAVDGQRTFPLPVLALNSDPEDSAPWLDPETGERFSSDQASLVLKLLRYAPRKPFTAPAVW